MNQKTVVEHSLSIGTPFLHLKNYEDSANSNPVNLPNFDYDGTGTETANELDLLKNEINSGLPSDKWIFYKKLVADLRTRRITAQKHTALIELSEEIEEMNNARLENLYKLASYLGAELEDFVPNYVSRQTQIFDKRLVSVLRQEILEMSKGQCEFCKNQEAFSFIPFVFGLIVSASKLGSFSRQNLMYFCTFCENRKAAETKAIDPVTGDFVKLFNPRTELWENHFSWSSDYLKIIGLTTNGRATVELLDLNRRNLLEHRRFLKQIKKHPLFLS